MEMLPDSKQALSPPGPLYNSQQFPTLTGTLKLKALCPKLLLGPESLIGNTCTDEGQTQ